MLAMSISVHDPKWPFRRSAKLDDSAGRGPRVKATPEKDRGPVVRLNKQAK